MSSSAISEKQVPILISTFIILNGIFLATMPLFPFIDLPNHLAEATIFKYWSSGNLLSQYYTPVPWYFPNTFHTVFCSIFPSVEWGNRIFHILYIALLQVSVFLVIRQLKGNLWYGALAIVYTYGYNVSFGFVGFAVSLPVLLILFYSILLYVEKEAMILNFVIALLLVLLFFMHAQNALLGLAIYGAMMAYHLRRNLKKLFLHGLFIPLPLLIIIFAWWLTRTESVEGNTFHYLRDYYVGEYFQNFAARFRLILYDNFQLRNGTPGLLISAAFLLCVLTPVLWWLIRSKKDWSSYSFRNLTFATIFLLVTGGCYLIIPDELPGQSPIFQRLCTIVMLAFVILGSILLREKLPWLKYLVIVTTIAYTACWWEYIYTFNEENKSFNKTFLAEIPSGSKVAGLIYANTYRGRNVYIHFPNYHIIWNHGIAASKIIDYRFGVIRRVASEDSLPFYEEWIGHHYAYQPQYGTIDYLLVRGTAPVSADFNLRDFSLWKKSGDWRLFRRQPL